VEKPSLPFAGGLSVAAVLAFALGPWAGQPNNPATPSPASTPTATPRDNPSGSAASATIHALSENEQGPWYALCKVFSTIDPEDIESTPDHPTRQQAGVEIHPPLAEDAENRLQEIKEETITERAADNRSVQRKFTPLYHSKANLASCLPTETSLPHKLTLRYIIATIPDPLGSHLALQFDRNIDAIERSAEAHGFRFERYWFPWNGILNSEHTTRIDSASDALKQQLREQPGILVFRQFDKNLPSSSNKNETDTSTYSSRLIVFLVGETPTSGINKVAFTKAATYIKQLRDRFRREQCGPTTTASAHDESNLCNDTLPLAVLGPNFSGSFSTLYRALHDLHEVHYVAYSDVVSPTTTVRPIIETFQHELKAESLGILTQISPFDGVTEDAMLVHLESLGYNRREIAYLSEDESSYSPGTERKDARIATTLTYPRDLSALRNTWQPTTITITPADISGETSKTQIAPFSLHEGPSNELDSPSAFATDQAAPDIDQALSSLIALIRHRRLRVIVVTASNPLDEVYLLQYVHRNAPDVRLATYDQDFLMLRATNYDSLRGTISVTSFPLDGALLFDKTNTAQFPNSAAEATYIGMRLLLSRRPIADPHDPREDSLSFTFDPTALTEGPGVYILGEDSFWPAKAKEPASPFSPDSLNVPWTWYVLVAAFIGAAIFHLRYYRKVYMPHAPKQGSYTIASFLHRIGLSGSRRREDLMQDYFLLVGTNQIVILLVLLSIPSVAVGSAFVGDRGAPFPFVCKCALLCTLALMSVVMIVVSALLSIRVYNSISKVATSAAPDQVELIGKGDLGSAIFYALVTLTIWCAVICHDWVNRQHAAFRTMYVLDGLSPLPVTTSVITVWYLLAGMGLRAAQAMKGMRVDPLFLSSAEGIGCAEWIHTLGSAQKTLLNEVESFVKLDLKSRYILLFCFFVLLSLQGWPALRGVDIYWFRMWLLCFGVGLLAASIIVQFFRIRSVWSRLRALLALLDISPLSQGFDRVPEDLTSVKVWRSRDGIHSRSLESYTFEILQRIANRSQTEMGAILMPYCESAESHVQDLLYKLRWDEHTHLTEHSLLNACFDACMSPAIRKGEDWFQRRCEAGDALVIDFAALRYVALIKYVNTQMRGLLSFVLYGYVFLLLGLQTYPFQGRHTIGSALTIVFSVLFMYSAVIFIQMDSNPLLSKLEHTTPGKTNYLEAAQRLINVGGIPLIAVLASQFPIIERFLIAWVKPTVESLH